MSATVDTAAVPRFPSGVRLQHDRARDQWVLLAPERVVELDEIAHAVLARVDGAASVESIVRALAEEYGAARSPLLKDPRVSVLLPLWRPVFEDAGLSPLCVIPVRDPLEVAGSLAKRDGFHRDKSILVWCAYMLAAERYSRDLPRVFVSYDALLRDWRPQAARIASSTRCVKRSRLSSAPPQSSSRALVAGDQKPSMRWP